MRRNTDILKNTVFDVLIIGGGIHGATIAREATLRGYKTALVEKGDFGSATSANSLKVIHGGLRYLQHANFHRIRQSIQSRKIFQQVAPHLIDNIPFLVPTYGYGIKSKFVMNAAIKFYDVISLDRNKNIPPENYLPGGKTISKNEILKIIPGIKTEGLTGGAVWYESISNDSERLILEFILQAAEYGAEIFNYIKVEKLLFENNKIKGALAIDLLTGNSFEIKADITVVAAGPWLNNFVHSPSAKFPLTKAVNIVVNKNLFGNYAVGLESAGEYEDKDAIIKRGKRLYFFVPLHGKTMIGTTYKKYSGKPDNLKITKHDIIEILDEVNKINPEINLSFDDVCFYHTGLLPMEPLSNPDDDIQPGKHSVIFDSENENGTKGGIFIKSVKFTTAPSIAIETVNLIDKKRGKRTSAPEQNYLHKPEIIENTTKSAAIPGEYISRIIKVYGKKRANKIINMITGNPQWGEMISETPPVTEAEIIYNIKYEYAQKLKDIVLRRTGLGNLNIPSPVTIEKIAKILQREFDLTQNETEHEITGTLDYYSILKSEIVNHI